MGEVRVVCKNAEYTFSEVVLGKNGKPVEVRPWTSLQSSRSLWTLEHALEQAKIALSKKTVFVNETVKQKFREV